MVCGKESGKHNGFAAAEKKLGALGSTAFFVGTRECTDVTALLAAPLLLGPFLIRLTCEWMWLDGG